MSEMVDRVADGLIARFKQTVAESAGVSFEETKVALPQRVIWTDYARAAIEAMREPTEEMMEAVDCAGDKRDWISGKMWIVGYQTMIDAALKES